MQYNYSDYVPIFKALADETRLKIIDMLSCGELCACDILESFNITQPTLSYHMKILTESGLVYGRREGAWMKYSLNTEKVNEVKEVWHFITTDKQSCICKTVKEENKCD
ncbi:metalloregulator ArsR/SmtB family transcription factor [Anaerocolumna sedimenticola]|uniref:Metalloregulator ArsR/SmtB family transcription factor n=1 Tax=Anaerocolumna sedimenticola TaxID=2696063 RepID=A0A6P1TMQ8_9FIRM|nr:metalloregulator ArsR/SmtB family transcription factor [Anaerocolumna sedimenticola]QHQ62284.1 metalloregulator ArsR/SmtB family transcription factor [Anaerocolumna sedimenticola]